MKSVSGTMEVAPWALLALKKQSAIRNGYQFRDACGRDHKYVDGSWTWSKDGGGNKIRVCLICRRDRKKALKDNLTQEQRDRIRETNTLQKRQRTAAKRMGITVAEYRAQMGIDIAKKNPLDYLRTTPEEGKAQDDLNFLVDKVGRPKCESDPDAYFSDTEMSNEDAERLCGGCPLISACFDRMKTAAPIGPTYMVAAKRVFFDGKILSK